MKQRCTFPDNTQRREKENENQKEGEPPASVRSVFNNNQSIREKNTGERGKEKKIAS